MVVADLLDFTDLGVATDLGVVTFGGDSGIICGSWWLSLVFKSSTIIRGHKMFLSKFRIRHFPTSDFIQ